VSPACIPRPASAKELRTALGELLLSQSQAACPDRFALRVGARLLETLVREEARGPSAKAAQDERMRRLLGADPATRSALCRAIALGEMGLDSPGLVDHLWATLREDIAIDQPDYLSGA
jgi:hypothetical protein